MKERPWLTIEKNEKLMFFADTLTPAWTILRSLLEYCMLVERVDIFEEDSYEDFENDTWYIIYDFEKVCDRALKNYPLYMRLVEYKIDGM